VRFVSFKSSGRDSFGVVKDDGGIIDLAPHMADRGIRSLRHALAADGLGDAAAAALGDPADFAEADIEFLPVIPGPSKIICVGLNFESHRLETGKPKAEYPTLFVRYANTQVGHRQAVVKPVESDKFDYEGELAVVIGREGRRIPQASALEFVAGYSCYQDASVRDWQRHSPQFTPGKNFPDTGGFGPWLVTSDEVPPWDQMTLETRVNGTALQKGRLDDLTYGVADLIAYISKFTVLIPGDVIITGTPAGVGFARKPPIYLRNGDIVEVEIKGVGTLVNPVVAETLDG
jgi:2-keto-4-pentenoate hydratase/2-oxohepta-3-ene-1,7-dioic acid hydratase in catechol pathway